jgi:hypothetical protein
MQRGTWAVGAKRILSKDPLFGAPGSGVGKEFEVIWIWPNSMAIQCHSFPALGSLSSFNCLNWLSTSATTIDRNI